MEKISFSDKDLIDILKEKIPEIEVLLFPEFDFSAYINYGTFGSFLRDKIIEEKDNAELINRSFAFLNFLIENGDEKILQMLRVETFEILTDYAKTIELTKQQLNEKALAIFLEVIKLLK